MDPRLVAAQNNFTSAAAAEKKRGRPRLTPEEKAASELRKAAIRNAQKTAAKIAKIQVDASLARTDTDIVEYPVGLDDLFDQVAVMRQEITRLIDDVRQLTLAVNSVILQDQTQQQPS